jgi:hypothetical protein
MLLIPRTKIIIYTLTDYNISAERVLSNTKEHIAYLNYKSFIDVKTKTLSFAFVVILNHVPDYDPGSIQNLVF